MFTFLVRRKYGDYRSDRAPYYGAVKRSIPMVDVRSTDDPANVPAYGGKTEWWFGEGENHRVDNGNIKRDFPGDVWVLECDGIDKLVEFVRFHGPVKMDPCPIGYPDQIGIELGDD
jgi:hypothetical protein